MMVGFPSLNAPIVDSNGRIKNPWDNLLRSIYEATGKGSGTISYSTSAGTLTPTSSPYNYAATKQGFLIVSGGGVSKMVYRTAQGQSVAVGGFYGSHPMFPGDMMQISYPGTAPSIVYVSAT